LQYQYFDKNTKLSFENENLIRPKLNLRKYNTMQIHSIAVIDFTRKRTPIHLFFFHRGENYGNLLILFLIYFIQLYSKHQKK